MCHPRLRAAAVSAPGPLWVQGRAPDMKALRLIDRQVKEGDGLSSVGVRERREVHVEGSHLRALVVQSRLPPDEILDSADHEMGGMSVRLVVPRRSRLQAIIDSAKRHRVR